MRFKKRLKKAVKLLLNYDESRSTKNNKRAPLADRDFSDREIEIIKDVSQYTMTGSVRIVSLIRALDYLHKNKIEGAIVECGVWKGGSVMAAMKASKNNNEEREVYLYDTFEGMSEPTAFDKSMKGIAASEILANDEFQKCISKLEEVENNVFSITYPKEKIHFVKGKVEDTIPGIIPEKIALLRLDTDWYESTRHELEHLFPKLVNGGILIIDDYGHWNGCKKAVDEYFDKCDNPYYLNRVDYTCRLIVKAKVT